MKWLKINVSVKENLMLTLYISIQKGKIMSKPNYKPYRRSFWPKNGKKYAEGLKNEVLSYSPKKALGKGDADTVDPIKEADSNR